MNQPEESVQREYDFSKGVRGKYAERFREGTNLVLLDAELVALFPTSDAVNKALRELLMRRKAG